MSIHYINYLVLANPIFSNKSSMFIPTDDDRWLMWHHMVVIHESNKNLFDDSLTTNVTIHQ
jgi:hypothetical protein